MGRILDSKGRVQYDAKGKAVSELAKNKGVTTSAVPSYDSFEDFQNANPEAASFASKIAGGFGINLADPAASRGTSTELESIASRTYCCQIVFSRNCEKHLTLRSLRSHHRELIS